MEFDISQIGNNIAYQSSQTKVNNAQEGLGSSESQNTDSSIDSNSKQARLSLVESTKESDFAVDKLVNEEQDLDSALSEVSDFVQAQNRDLNFSFDEKSQRSIIQVTDKESGDLIRQIPSEEILKLAERIDKLRTDAGKAVGVLINREV
jgi:flagellar protein FlaG